MISEHDVIDFVKNNKSYFSNNKISVGEPYFNSTVVPIMIPAILIMGIGPILSWGDKSTKKKLKIPKDAAKKDLLSNLLLPFPILLEHWFF